MASSTSLDELQRKFDENQRRYLAPLANEYRKAGELDRAIALCEEWLPQIGMQGKHLSGYVVFGQALYEAGRLDEAADAFGTALELDPENLIALRHMGDIARDQRDVGRAREWYERVLDADPRNEEIGLALQSLDDTAGTPAGARGAVPSAPFDASDVPHGFASVDLPSSGARDDARPSAYPSTHEADETFDAGFDPGFFAAAPTEHVVDHDASGGDASPTIEMVDEGAASEAPASAADAAHDFDPSELALAAALDAPLVPDAEAPGFERDAAFDFQATSLDALHGDAGADTGASRGLAFEHDSYGASSLHESAPTPAYGGGFDPHSFYGDDADAAPPAVTPPADIGLETMEFVGEQRDGDDAGSGEPGSPFVTETMAELYLQQGFRAEALDVYEQLLAANPGDANLRERVAQLRDGAPSSLGYVTGAYPAVDAPAGADAGAAYDGVDAGAASAAPDDTDEAHDVEPAELALAAALDAPLVEGESAATERDDVNDAWGPGGSMRSARGAADAAQPTAREFFAALARRGGSRASSTTTGDDIAAHSHVVAPEIDDPTSAHEVEPPRAAAGDAEVAHGGEFAAEPGASSLSTLFGGRSSADDERAATMLASLLGDGSMHGGQPGSSPAPTPAAIESFADVAPERPASPRAPTPQHVPAIEPAPSRPAARELSLDDVFGAPAQPTPAQPSRSAPAAQPAPGSGFSFDQFFADTAPAAAPAAAPAPIAAAASAPAPSSPVPAADHDEANDLAQFNAWLEGLKKR